MLILGKAQPILGRRFDVCSDSRHCIEAKPDCAHFCAHPWY
jgi:hypothetical protein